MKLIQVNYLEFDNIDDAMENINYPNSGLFVSKVKNGSSDLRLIDKSVKHNYFICPEIIFNSFESFTENTDIKEVDVLKNKYDGDFIIEFSKILLNRK